MTCDLDRVDALADGRLDGPEAKEVMEHLAGCPQCRAYYEGALAADRVLADTGINPPADFAAGVMERIRPRRQVQWPRAAAGLAACLLLAAGATLALPQAVPEPPSFYREYPELLSSEDQTLVFTFDTKGTDVFEEETRKETEMRYRQLPEESVPVVEDAGLCRRTAAALARQGIAPDDGGVYRLTPRQMETCISRRRSWRWSTWDRCFCWTAWDRIQGGAYEKENALVRGGGAGPVRAAAGCADPGTAPGRSREQPGQ